MACLIQTLSKRRNATCAIEERTVDTIFAIKAVIGGSKIDHVHPWHAVSRLKNDGARARFIKGGPPSLTSYLRRNSELTRNWMLEKQSELHGQAIHIGSEVDIAAYMLLMLV